MEKELVHRSTLAMLLLLGPGLAIWAGESAPALTGHYHAIIESGISATLDLEGDGSAQYIVTWFNGDATKVEQRYSGKGRWVREGTRVTLSLPLESGRGTIVHESSACLRYDSRFEACSPGLRPVTTDMPKGHTWTLWKSDEIKN